MEFIARTTSTATGRLGEHPSLHAPAWAHALARSLSDAEIETAVRTRLVGLSLEPGQILEGPGKPLSYVYFPDGCLVSLTALERGFEPVGVGIVGWGSMIGTGLVLGAPGSTYARATAETRGIAWALSAESFNYLNNAYPAIRHAFLTLVLGQLQEVSANAFALGRLGMAARLAWWLLRASTACRQNALPLAHDRLSMLIGARRETVSNALAEFEAAGAISARRKLVEILDRRILESFVRTRNK